MSIIKSRFFYIDSNQATSGTAGNFSYTMFQDINTYTHCVVTQASFPISYYIVRDGTNTFTLIENGTSVTISVPVGNYNVNSFQTVLTSLLNDNSPNIYTYAVSFPNQFSTTSTLKYTFTVSGNGSVQPIFSFPSTSLLYEQFGFKKQSINTFDSNSLSSVNVVSFVPETTLFIHSDISENYQDDILQEIYNNNSTVGGYCVYQLTGPPEVYAKRLQSKSSNTFKFFITDEAGNIIDFNGLNVLITIMLFQKDNSLDVLKKFIQHQANKELQQEQE